MSHARSRRLQTPVQLHEYDQIVPWLSEFASSNQDQPISSDMNSLNWAVYKAIISSGGKVQDSPSVVARLKAVKNQTEIEVSTELAIC
jgi:Xaa-Pro aminopeptidase